MKKGLLACLAAVACLAPGLASGAPAHPVVTGGGTLLSAAEAKLTVNAIKNSGSKGWAGKITYRREAQGATSELSVFADVQCAAVSTDGTRAVATGPIREKSDPNNVVPDGSWALVTVRDVTDGPGDQVRVRFVNAATAQADCANGADDDNVTPGMIIAGNFQVRPAPTP